MSNHVFIATSLDGYIADNNGSVDWLNAYSTPPASSEEDVFAQFMQNIDAVVMGRNTFEVVQSFGVWIYTKPVIVLSSTLQTLPEEYAQKAYVTTERIDTLLARLHAEGLQNLYIDGGKVIQSFLHKDLIDTMTITRIPVLLGGGIALFGKNSVQLAFTHSQSKVLNGGLVMDTYLRKR